MTENSIVEPDKMAPTDRVAYYHGLTDHLQIVTQKLLDSKEIQLDPHEWGWQCKNGQNLSPITTDREVAPENILKVIRCNCKKSANQCGTNGCSCRKNGLLCFITCGKCNGEESEDKQVSNVFNDIVINVQASIKFVLTKTLILY